MSCEIKRTGAVWGKCMVSSTSSVYHVTHFVDENVGKICKENHSDRICEQTESPKAVIGKTNRKYRIPVKKMSQILGGRENSPRTVAEH